LALAAFSIHVTLLLLAFSAGKFFNIPVPESKALIFVSSQKTLPVAASVIATLNGEIGGALISCLLFHFLQLIFDSFLAGMAAKEKPREEKLESCPEY
jgi:sodium/bile acid cotransporter 7